MFISNKTYLSHLSYSDFRAKLVSYEKPDSPIDVVHPYGKAILTRYYQDDLGEQPEFSACTIEIEVVSREQLKIDVTIEADAKNFIYTIFLALFGVAAIIWGNYVFALFPSLLAAWALRVELKQRKRITQETEKWLMEEFQLTEA